MSSLKFPLANSEKDKVILWFIKYELQIVENILILKKPKDELKKEYGCAI